MSKTNLSDDSSFATSVTNCSTCQGSDTSPENFSINYENFFNLNDDDEILSVDSLASSLTNFIKPSENDLDISSEFSNSDLSVDIGIKFSFIVKNALTKIIQLKMLKDLIILTW